MYPVKNLRRRSARTLFLVIGVALAITLTTIMYSIGEGINASTREIVEETNVDLFVYPKSANPILQEFTKYFDLNDGRKLAAKIREGNPAIKAASPWLAEGIHITSNVIDEGRLKNAKEGEEVLPSIYSVTGKGYVPELMGDFGGVDYYEGTDLLTQTDPFYANGTYAGGLKSENFTHEIVLNHNLASLLDVSIGDRVYVRGVGLPYEVNRKTYDAWIGNASWYIVQGIMVELYEPATILTAAMHLSELQYFTGKHRVSIQNLVFTDYVNEIYVELYDQNDRAEVKHWLLNEFEDKDRITVITSDELTSELNSFLDIFRGFSDMIIIITSLVVVLFISTIMMISVQEQGHEIGMLRAIGISKKTIIKQILAESIVICLIGFVAGLIFGYVGADLLEEYILSTEGEIPAGVKLTKITPELILQVSFITLAIGILAGVIPALWASKVTPIRAIRKV